MILAGLTQPREAPAPKRLAPEISAFLAMLAVERGAAPNTIAAYRRDLVDASEKLGNLATADDPALTSLAGEWSSLAPSSLARKYSALRQFFGFLVDEGYRLDDPTPALASPHLVRPLPRLLGHGDIATLFATAEAEAAGDKREAVRNLVLLELLYGSGLRATELVSLPLSSVPRDVPMLTVTGKGGVQRVVPVSTRARQALSRWLELRGAGQATSRYLFPSTARQGHLTRVRLFQLLRELGTRAGIAPERLSPHVLRHAFATHLLAGGADLRVLQTLLGHADIATTEIYTHVEPSRLVALVNQRHPLAHRTG